MSVDTNQTLTQMLADFICYMGSGEQKPYRNYKKLSSLLQAAVLKNRSFSYIFADYSGSAHDSTILQRSSLFEQLKTDFRAKFNPDCYHTIGNPAFPFNKQSARQPGRVPRIRNF